VLEDLRFVWGEERVYFLDDKGDLVRFPASWTSVGAVDPFVVVSDGRSMFRVSDLLRLVDMAEELQDRADASPRG
jgi:hypothetical protein